MRINHLPQKIIYIPLVVSLLLMGLACSKKEESSTEGKMEVATPPPPSEPKTEAPDRAEQKALRALGYQFGREVSLNVGLTEDQMVAIFEGMRRQAAGKAPPANFEKQLAAAKKIMLPKIEAYSKNQQKEEGEMSMPNIEAGKAYIAELEKSENLKKTASGLYYKMVREGDGDNPEAADTVKVHYHGTLIDGTEFDSSYSRNKPATFPLNRVIAGWTEGLQLVREGGEIMLYIPSDLGYGNQPRGGVIKEGDTLVFRVELLEIVTRGEGS